MDEGRDITILDTRNEFEEEAAVFSAGYNDATTTLSENGEWAKLLGNFQLNILGTLIRCLLEVHANGTAMMERIAGELRITVAFPPGHVVNQSIKIRLLDNPPDSQWPCEPENGKGIAGYAACRGFPVYVPYTRSDCGSLCSSPSQSHSSLQYTKIGPGIWQLPRRKDFKSMISVPVPTYITGVPARQWRRYGVLNVEGKKRDEFDTDDIHSAAIAARIVAQGLEHAKKCEAG